MIGDPASLPIGYPLVTSKHRYKITGYLGNGGYGITYKAVNENAFRTEEGLVVPAGTILAIKECYREDGVMCRLSDGKARPCGNGKLCWELRKKFIDEARFLFVHASSVPGVVRLYHIAGPTDANNNPINCDAIFYFVMPYLPGGSLHQQRQCRDWHQIRTWLESLLHTLSALHSRGVTHRDIKPGNVMLDAQKKPVLIDFGLAMQVNVQGTGVLNGYSPHFAAPEQFPHEMIDARMRQYHVTAQSDLYSMGATFYDVITGEEPCPANKRISNPRCYQPLISHPIVKSRLEDLSTSDRKIAETMIKSIDKAMEIVPEQRWNSADDWLSELLNAGPSESVIGKVMRRIRDLLAGSKKERTFKDKLGILLVVLAVVVIVCLIAIG